MASIAIITDTDSSLPLDLAKKYDIQVVPIIIQFGEESFKDVYEIDNAAVFSRVDREGKLPTTAAPSPGSFVDAYRRAFDSGADQILCLTISSEMSAVYTAARTAAETFPGKAIRVVDSRSLAFGEGMMVLEAARRISDGATLEEALAAAVDLRDRSHLFAALSTLKYLAMSGRVGQVAAGFATLLDVKPILTLRNEKLEMLERVRTQHKAWERLIDLSCAASHGRPLEHLCILHANAAESARQFEKQARAALDTPAQVDFIEITPGLSIHTGAGLVGLVMVNKK